MIDSLGAGYFRDIAKWAHMLSILGYIGIGFLVVVGLFIGTIMNTFGQMGSGMGAAGAFSRLFFTVIYLLIAIVYFFPVNFLNRFAVKLKTALRGNDQETLNRSPGFLKSHYQYIGILAIITVIVYIIIFGIMAASMAAMWHAM